MTLPRRAVSLTRTGKELKTHSRAKSSLRDEERRLQPVLSDWPAQERRRCGNNIFRYQKACAIKEIINNYFKEDINSELEVPKAALRLPRRYSRLEKHEERLQEQEARIMHQQQLPFQQQSSPTLRKPTRRQHRQQQEPRQDRPLAQTCYELGWPQHQRPLPPIHEQVEDPEEALLWRSGLSETSSFVLRSSCGFSEGGDDPAEEKSQITFENELFRVLLVIREGKPVGRVKEFKEAGLPALERELRMRSFNLPSIWTDSPRSPYAYETGMQSPLRHMLSRLSRDEAHSNVLRIRPRGVWGRLAAEGFRELRGLLRDFCQDLLPLQGRVLNNKINPQNLFLTKNYRLCAAEWGYASFREAYNIQKTAFESRIEPLLHGSHGWLVPPEYLAPELVTEMLGQGSMAVWEAASSPDIWSLGLTIFELMTLVPIWCPKCQLVLPRPGEYSTLRPGDRSGLMTIPGRDLRRLQERQIVVRKAVEREIEGWSPADKQLGHLVLRMLEPLPKRISLQELIAEL